MKLKLAGLIVALPLTISGCFGGSGSDDDGRNPPPPGSAPPPPPPPPPPPTSAVGGLWAGLLSWDPRNGLPGGVLAVRALVAETGEFRFVLDKASEDRFNSQSEQVFGTFSIDGATIETSGDAYWAAALGTGNPGGELWSNFGMSAEFEPAVSVSGVFQATWTNFVERLGTLDMTYHSLYENDSSLAALQGTFTTSTDTLTIDDEGVIFYQSSDTGCTGNGSAEVIDPEYNMYRVEIQMGGCTGDFVRNGMNFTGLANIGVNNELGGGFINDTLEMAVSASYADGLGPTIHIPCSLLAHRQ